MNNLPVDYFSQKSWIDLKIFSEWFHEEFVPNVKHFCQENGIN